VQGLQPMKSGFLAAVLILATMSMAFVPRKAMHPS
jgi:hypothetical protein